MSEKDLAALQPTAQTGPEIRAALGRIESAKASAHSRARDAQAELDERARGGTLSSAQRRKFEDIIHDQQQEVVRLDVLVTEISAPLAQIEAVERAERLGAEVVTLEAEKKMLVEKWLAAYPALAEKMKALLNERNDFIKRASGKGIDLAEFRLPTEEIRLMKSSEQREYDDTPQWLHESRALTARIKAENAAAAARGPRVVSDDTPQPTLTVGGVVQAMPGKGW